MSLLLDLKIQFSELDNQVQSVEERLNNLRSRRRREHIKMFGSYVTPLVTDVVEPSHQGIHIKQKDSTWSYVDMYVKREYRDDGDFATDLEINVGRFDGTTSNSDGQWIVERMEKIAEYTKLFVDFKDDIIAEYNVIEERYSKMIQKLYEVMRPLRKELRSVSDKVKQLENDEMIAKLMNEGVKFERPEGTSRYYAKPSLEAKFDWNVTGIDSIKVTKVTPSGKSVDVEITNMWYGPRNENKPLVIKNVRKKNVDHMLSMFNDWIVK
jgi:hypothetical protein